MSITTQETIDALQRELALVAERQVELRLKGAAASPSIAQALEKEHQRISHQLELLQQAQRNALF